MSLHTNILYLTCILYNGKFSFGLIFHLNCYQEQFQNINTEFFIWHCARALVYTSNKGLVWREILIEPAAIASHHRMDEETATAARSCGYQNKLDLALYVSFMHKILGKLFMGNILFSHSVRPILPALNGICIISRAEDITLLLLLLTGTIFSYFCMSSITSVPILAILIAIVLF